MLRDGAELDELEPEELEPDELEPDAPESRESPLEDVDGLAVEALPDEVAAELSPACFAVSFESPSSPGFPPDGDPCDSDGLPCSPDLPDESPPFSDSPDGCPDLSAPSPGEPF